MKIKKIIMIMIFLISFLNIETVKADDKKYCYYMDDNSKVRLELSWVNKKSKASDFIANIDVLNGSIKSINGKILNYASDYWYSASLMATAGSINIYNFPGYVTLPENAFTLGIMPVCPDGFLYVKDYKTDYFFVYRNDQYESIKNALEKYKGTIIKTYVFNSTQTDKDTYFGSYRENLEKYIGQEVKIEGCNIIDDDLKKIIGDILKYISIIVPIGVIGLSSYELAKALGKGKDDEMKKAQKRLVIRIFVSLLIFLTPTIVNFLFDVAEKLWHTEDLYTCSVTGEELGKSEESKSCYVCGGSSHAKFVWTFDFYLNGNKNCAKQTQYVDEDSCLNNN